MRRVSVWGKCREGRASGGRRNIQGWEERTLRNGELENEPRLRVADNSVYHLCSSV